MPTLATRPAALLIATAGVVAGLCPDASATLRRDPMTLDRGSYSVLRHSISMSSIYHIATTPGEGKDVSGVGPLVHVSALDFGAVDPADNVLDISNGESAADFSSAPYVYFSVSDTSQGTPGSAVRQQADLGQQAADRFVVKASGSPSATLGGTGPATATNQQLSINQTYYNFAPSIGPGVFNSLGAQDDADSLEITEFKFSGPGGRTTPVYFTMDAASPTLTSEYHAPGEQWQPSDILFTPVGSNTAARFLDHGDLRLHEDDVIDGLAVWDSDNIGVADDGDAVLLSLAPGSPYLTNNGFSAADIFVAGIDGGLSLYLSAADLGLLSTDNIDALDVGSALVIVPEPTTLALAGIAVMLGGRRRRM